LDTRLSLPLRRLRECDLAERLFYSVFLCGVGVGYLMAVAFLYLSNANLDGKPGLSLADIADHYYGNRSGTRLEAAIRGPMSGYLTPDTTETIVAWLKSGAGRRGFKGHVQPILNQRCIGCHNPTAATMGLPDLTTLEGAQAVARVDTGQSITSLVRLSHIHLFGVGLILFTVGLVFRMADLPTGLKITLLLLPFGAIVADIGAWFLTRWDSVFAATVVVAGTVLGLSLAAQILISLYQMWIPARAGRSEGGTA
jgi:hypothetical protein